MLTLTAECQLPRKTALITGASFGIGLELARIFAREGYNLVLVARSADKLRQLASELEKAHGTRSLILAVDLTEPGAPAYVLDQTTRADIQVDVLVNNAGFGQYGMFAENDLEECLRQIQLNVTTLTHLTRLYLPAMIERKSRTHPERRLHRGVSARTADGRLLRHQSLRSALVGSAWRMNSRARASPSPACAPDQPPPSSRSARTSPDIRLAKYGTMDARTVAEDGYRALIAGKTSSDFRIQELADSAIGSLRATTNGHSRSKETTGRIAIETRKKSVPRP